MARKCWKGYRPEPDRTGLPTAAYHRERARLDAEVARVASLMLRSLPDGSPDVQGFLKMVAEKQGIPPKSIATIRFGRRSP